MQCSHLILLEELANLLKLNSIAGLVFKVYARNPHAKFDNEVKPVIENFNDSQSEEKEIAGEKETKDKELEDYLRRKESFATTSEYWFIKNLYIRDFRKYPLLKGDYFFRLNLEGKENKVPQSLILIGNNGVGKSTLYSAIEYITGNAISEAVMRKLDQGLYTKHTMSSPDEDIRVKLHTNEVCFYKPVDFINHFVMREMNILLCSENDILELGQSDGDEILLWASICGYREICELINNLDRYSKQLKNGLSDAIEYPHEVKEELEEELKFLLSPDVATQLVASMQSCAERLENFVIVETDTDERKNEFKACVNECYLEIEKKIISLGSFELLKEMLSEFEGMCHQLIAPLEVSSVSSFKSSYLLELEGNKRKLIGWMQDLKNKYNDFVILAYKQKLQNDWSVKISEARTAHNNKLSGYIEDYVTELRNALVDKVLDIFDMCKETITQVMEYFGKSFPDYEFRCYQKDRKIKLEVCEKERTTMNYLPNYFFNNFRFKLLYMTLKVAAGIASMKKYGPFPIILDDIFYASDFYSRKNIQWFWKALLDLLGPDLQDKVQIICFTHDEVVFSAIREAILKEYEPKHFTFGRLLELNWKELEGADYIEGEKLNLYVNLYS